MDMYVVAEGSASHVAHPGGGGKTTDGRNNINQDFTCKPGKAEEMSWGLNNIKRWQQIPEGDRSESLEFSCFVNDAMEFE